MNKNTKDTKKFYMFRFFRKGQVAPTEVFSDDYQDIFNIRGDVHSKFHDDLVDPNKWERIICVRCKDPITIDYYESHITWQNKYWRI